jgi:prolyl oligopeptidase PreP (S9A serine peptidase family)
MAGRVTWSPARRYHPAPQRRIVLVWEDWHEAGRREGKRLSHDDFAAVAADLVARGVTRPGRIAAEGGSNGGLLIAKMLTRYAERFGALLCAAPVIDMRRSKKQLVGNIGIDDRCRGVEGTSAR